MNAIYGANKLKLGLFYTNGVPALSLAPEVRRPRWDRIVEVAQLADQAGFEALLAAARWKGYTQGLPEQGAGFVMDPFAWAAGLSQVTKHITLIATAHGPVMHPVLVAKLGATIDLMSGGRFGLNLVGGWNKIELDMFGGILREHDVLYDELDEWIAVLKQLWTSANEFDFKGRYYDVVGGLSRPQPQQKPYPPIINAGTSDRGMEFAANNADICFIRPAVIGEQAKMRVNQYKELAHRQGREVQVWTWCAVYQRDSRAEAEDYLEYITGEMADQKVIDGWAAGVQATADRNKTPPAVLQELRRRFAAGSAGPILVGNARDIADQMAAVSEIGIDGMLLTCADFTDGVKRFLAPGSVMSELEARGLREPFVGFGE